MRHVIGLISVILLLRCLQFAKGQNFCGGNEDIINNTKIRWPRAEASQSVVSIPPCVNEGNILVRRTCVNGTFSLEPKEHGCVSVQQRFSPKCLPDHVYTEGYCFYVGEPQRWSSDNPVFEVENILNEYIGSHLQDRFLITQFWLPVRRTEPYGKFVWTSTNKNLEQFSYYNSEYIPKYNPDFVLHDCMIVDHITHGEEGLIYILKPEDCKRKHGTVFAYKPQNRYFVKHNSLFYSVVNNNAYFVVNTRCSVLAEPRTLEDNYLMKTLVGNQTCRIGIRRDDNGTFRWASDNSLINHTDWTTSTNFDNSVVVITKTGWSLEKYASNISHSICQIDHNNYQIELNLKPSRNQTQLTLTALSYQSTSKIVPRAEGLDDINLKAEYTNVSVYNDFSNVPNKFEKLDIRKVWHVKFENSGSNYYYFNGLGLPNRNVIQTEKIYLSLNQQRMRQYSFKVRIKKICDRISCDPQYKNNYENISRYLFRQADSVLKSNSSAYDSIHGIQFRAVKIKEIKRNWDIAILFQIYVNSTIGSIIREYQLTKGLLKELDEFMLDLLVHKNETIHPDSVTNDQRANMTRHRISIDHKYLKSCDGCLPEVTNQETNDKRVFWEYTPIGKTYTTIKKCFRNGEIYFSRKCSGNHLEGAKWEKPKMIFEQIDRFPYYSSKFCEIYENRSQLTPSQIMNKLSQLTTNNFDLKPLDIYYISEIFADISESESIAIADPEDREFMARNTSLLISNMLTVDKSSFEEIDEFTNTTNSLIAQVENFLPKITEDDLDDQGVKIIVEKNFIHVNIDPFLSNITGIALFTPDENHTFPFTEYMLETLTANISIQSLISLENLETAVYVPEKLLNDIKKQSDGEKVRISINVFYNDSLFIESKNNTNKAHVLTKVYSIVIKGYDNNLYSHLPVISRLNKKFMTPQPCGFWDFGSEGRGAKWIYERNKDTEIYLENNLQVCYYKHLTNFAMLLGHQIGVGIREKDNRNLELLTAIGCLLSIIGISGIFLTALVFKSWRHKIGSKIILNVSFCILLQIVLLYLNLKYTEVLCVITGTLLHYSVLCGFSWSLIMAVLQYLKFVKVIGGQTPHLLLKSSIVGWILPIIPVAVAVGINYSIRGKYMPNLEQMGSNICYPQGKLLYLTLLLPITLIVSTNLVMFFIILYNISCRPKIRNTCSDRKMFIQQLKLAIFLFFLLGLTWISGLITMILPSTGCLYLFSATASLQGFILFLFYVILDQSTLGLWTKMIIPAGSTPRKTSQTQTQPLQNENKSDYSSNKESGVGLTEAVNWNAKTQDVIKELEQDKHVRNRGMRT